MNTHAPPIWVYEDHGRGLALLRGQLPVVREVLDLALLGGEARYSTSGKGWVLQLDHVADMLAAAEMTGVSVRFKAVGE